jgi:hypothetical protein
MAAGDPMERLSSAYRIEVDEDTKTRHIAEMRAALESPPPVMVPAGVGLRRRFAGALAAVFVVAAPVGMAVAAEDAVPGEFLYPVKQATERVHAVFDAEVEATHRVEEVERLVFLRAPREAINRAVERAEAATSELTDRDTLGSRLESARRRVQEHDEEAAREREAGESESREQGEAERRPGTDSTPGSDEGAREGSGNADGGSQPSGQSGATSTTTIPPMPAGSGEGGGDRPAEGSPDDQGQPGSGEGTGETLGESPGGPESERPQTSDGADGGSGTVGSSTTTVP